MPHEDYARSTGQPRTITLGGVDYRVSKFTPRILGELEAWIKEVVPNPKAEARQYMQGLPDSVQLEIWKQANEEARDWPPGVTSEAGQHLLLMTAEGQARFLFAILRRGAADLTVEKARDLADRLDTEDFRRLTELAMPGEVGDPKAPEETGPPTS